jgi:hypothetical protein
MRVVKGCMVVPRNKAVLPCYGLYYFLRQMGGGGEGERMGTVYLCLLF